MKKILTQLQQQKGFVILFTILISTIILMIGLGIFSIATRETALSSTAREAQYAFYASDAGVECSLYAYSKNLLSTGGGYIPNCGVFSQINITGIGSSSNPFVFDILVDPVGKTCAHVTVVDNGNSQHVISQGYNICDAAGHPITTNPLLVERDLDITYATGTSAGSSTTTQINSNGGIPVVILHQLPVGSTKTPGNIINQGTNGGQINGQAPVSQGNNGSQVNQAKTVNQVIQIGQ